MTLSKRGDVSWSARRAVAATAPARGATPAAPSATACSATS